MEQQNSTTGAADASVRVAVRVRGLLPKELSYGAQSCIAVDAGRKCVSVGTNRRFTFDHTFDANSTQDDVYSGCVASLVDSCFQGYNATVLAYGQTGSGKTFTMGTSNLALVDTSQEGVAPRVIRQLYEGMAARKDYAAFQVRAQFLEIHNEELRDLLHPEIPQKALAIRETPEGDITVTGAKETVALSCQHLLHLLDAGSFARSTGRTLLNEHSSRSHAIFTIILEQHIFGNGQQLAPASAEYRCAKFHLVDLAGSERTKRSGAVGVRFKETVNINQGLLALGNVISALGDERKRGGHVPYRDSRLTRLLQDSLGGNSQTCMIACVSSSDDSLDETMNTLKYANRARNIQNKPIVNREQKHTSEALLEEAQALKLAILKQAIERPGCIALSDLLRVDLSNPTAATLQHLQQLAFTASQQSAEGTCPFPENQLQADELEAFQQEVLMLRMQLQQVQGSQELMTSEAEALLAVQQQLRQRVHDREEAAAAAKALTATLVACGHMTTTAQQALDECLSNPEWHPSLSDIQAYPGLAALATAGQESVAGQPALTNDARASLHSHPLLAMSVARSCIAGAARQEDTGAGTSDQIRLFEQKLQDLTAQLAERDEELMAAREDLQHDEVVFAKKLNELQSITAEQELQATHKTVVDGQQQREQNLVAELEHWRAKALQAEEQLSSCEQPRTLRGLSALAGQTLQFAGLGASGCSTAAAEPCDDQVIYDDDLLSYISETDYTDMQRSVVWPEPDPVLHDQLQKATAERLAAEEQRKAAEAAAAEKEEQFALARESLNAQLQDLTEGIRGKEAVIAQLITAEADARAQSEQLLARMRQLELDIQNKQAALSDLKQELEELEASARQRSKEDQDALRQQYDQRIQAAEAQMLQLKQQLQTQELMQANKERQRSRARIQHLQDDLAKMQSQHDELRKNLRHKNISHERQAVEQQKEISSLRRAAEIAQRKLKELEASNARQKVLIKNMQSDAIAAKRKTRMSDDSRIVPDRGARDKKAPGVLVAGAGSAAGTDQHQQQWVEKQLQVIKQHKDAQLRLDMLQEKKSKLRAQQQDLGCTAAKHRLQSLRSQLHGGASHQDMKPFPARRGDQLSSSTEANDAEDLLDSIAVELEYIAEQESEARAALQQAQRAWEALKRRAAGMTTREAQGAVSAALALLVYQNESQRALQAQLKGTESSLQQTSLLLETAQLAVQMKDQDAERRLQELQAEHSHKVQSLLRQIKHLLTHGGPSSAASSGAGDAASPLAHPLSLTSSMVLDSLHSVSPQPSGAGDVACTAAARLQHHEHAKRDQPLPMLVSRHLQMRRSQPAGLGTGTPNQVLATIPSRSAQVVTQRQAGTLASTGAQQPACRDQATSRDNQEADSAPTKDQPLGFQAASVSAPSAATCTHSEHPRRHNLPAGKAAATAAGQSTSEDMPTAASRCERAAEQGTASSPEGKVVQLPGQTQASAFSNESLRQQLSPYKRLLMRQSGAWAHRSLQVASDEGRVAGTSNGE